jgi:hypothetical protein
MVTHFSFLKKFKKKLNSNFELLENNAGNHEYFKNYIVFQIYEVLIA